VGRDTNSYSSPPFIRSLTQMEKSTHSFSDIITDVRESASSSASRASLPLARRK